MKNLAILLALTTTGFAATQTAPLPGMPLNEAPSTLLKEARFETRKDWDISFNLAFHEYYVAEEGIQIATGLNGSGNPSGQIVAFDFDYHPGFALGFTINTPYDSWVIEGEYLWLRATNHVSATAAAGGFIYSNFVFGYTGYNNYLGSLTADWSSGVDLIDLSLSRPFYAGRDWTVSPSFGLRTGWFREYVHAICSPDGSPNIYTTFDSNSWSIGPRGGVQTNWLLGKGFSFFGNLSASLLYHRYSTLIARNSTSDYSPDKGHVRNNSASFLSPNLDTGLGVKWGSYFSDLTYYFDVSAAYNFSVFFAQRQLSTLNGLARIGATPSPGKLYWHGISIKTSLLF